MAQYGMLNDACTLSLHALVFAATTLLIVQIHRISYSSPEKLGQASRAAQLLLGSLESRSPAARECLVS